jgi:hypothetical protein
MHFALTTSPARLPGSRPAAICLASPSPVDWPLLGRTTGMPESGARSNVGPVRSGSVENASPSRMDSSAVRARSAAVAAAIASNRAAPTGSALPMAVAPGSARHRLTAVLVAAAVSPASRARNTAPSPKGVVTNSPRGAKAPRTVPSDWSACRRIAPRLPAIAASRSVRLKAARGEHPISRPPSPASRRAELGFHHQHYVGATPASPALIRHVRSRLENALPSSRHGDRELTSPRQPLILWRRIVRRRASHASLRP